MNSFNYAARTSWLALAAAALLAAPAAQAQTLSEDFVASLQWREIGPTAAGGRIIDLDVVESTPRIYYVSSSGGGLWKTTNNGITFKGLFQHEGTISIGDTAISQSNPDIIYVGTGEQNPRNSVSWGDGVYKSTDAGETWRNMGLRETFQIGRMAVHPTDPDTVYVGALGRLWGPNEERGVYKTTDGGETWTKSLHISDDTGIIELQMDPSNPETLLAAAYQRRREGFDGGEPAVSSGPESGVYKTTDGGANWKRLTEGLPQGDMGRTGISYYRANPDIILLQTGGSRVRDDSNGVYRSEDGGETWEMISDNSVRPMYYTQIRVDPSNDQFVYTVATSSHRSTDGGHTFQGGFAGRSKTHEDSHALWIDHRDGAHMLMGNDGGLFESFDYGDNWDFKGVLPIAQSYHVGLSPQRRYWAFTGLQDNGNWGAPAIMRGTRGATNEDWLAVSTADGFICLVDPNDPDTLYYETQNGNMRRVNLKTNESARITPQGERRWNWEAPMLLSPHNSQIFLTAAKRVYRSYNRGDDSRPISDDLSISEPGLGSAVAQSPVNPDVIYAGYTDGALWVTRDGGEDWARIDENVDLPGLRWVDSIEASRYAEGRVYVAFDGHRSNDGAPHAYVSEDFGATWRSMNDGLPEMGPTRALREDIESENLLYLGTEFAMFASVDRGHTWAKINSNMPTVAVHEVAIHPLAGEIVAATHGRGLWILDVAPLRQMTEEIAEADAHLFEPHEAVIWGRGPMRRGDLYGTGRWYATNPYNGALIYYRLGGDAEEITLTIANAGGDEVRSLSSAVEGETGAGLHRIEWDLRATPEPGDGGGRGQQAGRGGRGQRGQGGRGGRGQQAGRGGRGGRGQQAQGRGGRGQQAGRGGRGARGQQGRGGRGQRGGRGGRRGGRGGGRGNQVAPGTYQVTLTVDGETFTQSLTVIADPGDN